MLDWNLLAELVAAPGLPGREGPVAVVIEKALPSSFKVSRDRLGNLAACRPGPGARWMLVAHMDEVGLIVRRITPQGYLLVERLGGMSLRALPGSPLTVWTESGTGIPATAGTLPAHLDNTTITPLVYLDLHTGSAEATRALGVQVGDGVTWAAGLRQPGEHALIAKALDDRLGCFTLLSLAQRLVGSDLSCDLTLAFTVQEETMLSGGLPLIQAFQPEFLVGVDGTLAFDTPDLLGQQSDLRLGAGPALKWMDAIRGKMAAFVPDLEFARRIRRLAREQGLPLQDEVVSGISTAITPMVFGGAGVRAAALSLPVRYHHTPSETADKRDVEHLVKLLMALVSK
jgi:putative aminopeptidase FrvX